MEAVHNLATPQQRELGAMQRSRRASDAKDTPQQANCSSLRDTSSENTVSYLDGALSFSKDNENKALQLHTSSKTGQFLNRHLSVC